MKKPWRLSRRSATSSRSTIESACGGRGGPLRPLSAGHRAAIVACVLALSSGACSREPPREQAGSAEAGSAQAANLVLITIDTLRGDHFGGAQGGVPLTPNLSRLAERCLDFRHASSVSNATSPGVAGILTGLWPRRSGVVVNDSQIPEVIPTLGTRLRGSGFLTAAFVANPVLAPGHGFDRGFATYELLKRQRPWRKARADALTDAGLAWLAQRSADHRRFFLWLHYMDPHGPYQPPEAFIAEFPLETYGGPVDIPLLPPDVNSGRGGIPAYQQLGQVEPATDGRHYRARYSAEIRFMDYEIGRVLDLLESSGLFERSVVVVTADHGEALIDDHGYYFSHGNGLTQDQIHVPLVLSYPGCEPGVVADRPVSTVDVLPTVLELLAIEPNGEIDGGSLLSSSDRIVVSQALHQIAVRRGSWKLSFAGKRSRHLFDLARDPMESANLAESRPEDFENLTQLLVEVRRRPALAKPVKRRSPTEKQARELKALGYL